jgi:hypothetical protein
VNPFVVEQDFNLFHDDLPFMGPIMRFAATDGGRGTSVDAKFKTEDRETNAGGIKAIPVVFDDRDNFRADNGIDIGSNIEVFL